jgi:gliding motility-associated-like protein
MEFIENKGQWDKNIKYKGSFSTGSFFLEQQGFSVLIHDGKDLNKIARLMHGGSDSIAFENDKTILHSHAYRVNFLGSNPQNRVYPEKPMNTYSNYFIGDDKSTWQGGCKIYQSIIYKNIYNNIDVRYYISNNQLKYDFIVNPNGNATNIALLFDGAEKIEVKNNELIIQTSVGMVKELQPFCYQPNDKGEREKISCKYVLVNNVVRFQLGNYDITKPVIIDPTIIFSSFTGSTSDNWGYSATPGPDGTLFAGGIVFGDGYPVTTGAFQSNYSGGVIEGNLRAHDIAIFKFSADGSSRLYATYLGGNGNEQPHSMITDKQGNLIVAGRSSSNNFPTTIPRIGVGGGHDIIISKFNANGTSLIGSIKIGGSSNDGINIRSKYELPDGADRLRRNYGDDARSEVILDANENILLASCTQSSNFPVAGAPLNPTGGFGGGFQDGLILKFNANLSAYLYGSYFGGSGDDACFVTSINPITNDIFVAGGTTSADLPGNKTGVLYPNYMGGTTDGFITQLRLDGSGIIRTSYMGTSGIDIVYGLKFDKNGYPYIMGTTTGAWPVLNAAFSNPGSSQFISKLNPDFSSFKYSTVFGTGSNVTNLSPIGFMVDRCENVYFSGWGGGINVYKRYTNGNTNGLPLVNSLPGINTPDGEDLYFFVLKKNASAQLFGSNFGQFRGTVGDHVDGGTSRFDENGIIYQAICANCNGGAVFPTTSGVWSRNNGSVDCNQAVVKIEMSFSGVAAAVRPSINGVINDTMDCVPFRVDFIDTLQKGKKMYWDFGNGKKDTTTAPNFSTYTTYSTVGNYIVRVIAEDSLTCNIRDTVYLKIKAGNNLANLAFNSIKNLPCTNLSFNFNNLSIPTRGNFSPSSFTWNFGDGSAEQVSYNAIHTFPAVGQYTVTLKLNDSNFCNSPAIKTITLNVNDLVKAKFNTSPVGCAPYLASFFNQSGTPDVTWEFSDGTTNNLENPTKLYNNPGTYTVRLIARDPNTCNKIDTSAYFTIVVSERPHAEFTWQPNPPEKNTPTRFTNLSIGAVRYQWDFGDGESSTEVNPIHLYNASGNYNAVLIAFNQYNCTDTFPLRVTTLVDPLLDVPNAFTPGKFGVNGIVKVRGFGIAKMDWKIYNRWGQLVFQSQNYNEGWNGIFKGKAQPMDVYTFTLDVEFTDGRKTRKTGDITLIR